jgi:hypothetical protein
MLSFMATATIVVLGGVVLLQRQELKRTRRYLNDARKDLSAFVKAFETRDDTKQARLVGTDNARSKFVPE